MENNKSYSPVKIASERSFGIIFGIIFLIIGIYPLLNDANIRLWSCIVAFIFFMLEFSFSAFAEKIKRKKKKLF